MVLAALLVALLARCSSAPTAPAGPAADYATAKDDFAKGNADTYNKALTILEKLGSANPANDFSARAQVLRAVILAGQVEASLKVADVYAKGAETSRNADARTTDSRLRQDAEQSGSGLALALGQCVMDMTKGGALPKDLSLDAPYPEPAPPASAPGLEKVKEGLLIGPDEQEQALLDTEHAVMAGLLADLAGGGDAKSKLSAGPAPLNAPQFALFLGERLMSGAAIYDKKHLNDPIKFKLVAGVADRSAQLAAAALKESPDAELAKRLKKLQDQVKSGTKAM